MQGSIDAARSHSSRVMAGDRRPRVASTRASLIDTRLVRVELARLRMPRPGTEVHRARIVRSTVSTHA
jgi:hypothetical protein